MVQWTTINFQNHVQEAYTFNSPGIPKEEAEKLKKGKGAPQVTHYVTRGDVVSTAGDRLIGDDIIRLEGRATRQLEKLIRDGALALAEKALNAVPDLIDSLASTVATAPKIWNIVMFLNDHTVGIAALKAVGMLAGDLHSQRLFRASQVPKSPYPGFMPGGQSPLDFPIDAAELAEKTGPVIAKPSGQVTDKKNEQGRRDLSPIVDTALPVIFNKIIPFIQLLQKHTGMTAAIELSPGAVSMVQTLALQLKPIIRPVVEKIAAAGGLEAIFKRALD
jgi:hypothetical protein